MGAQEVTSLLNHLAPRQIVCIMIFIHVMSLPGPHRVQYFLLTQGVLQVHCSSIWDYLDAALSIENESVKEEVGKLTIAKQIS